MTDPWLFVLAVATLLGTPGPTNTLMATAGALSGPRAAWPLLFAEVGAYLIAILTIRLVLAPVLHDYPAVTIAIKIAVALYLVWLAIRLWQRPITTRTDQSQVRFSNVFVTTLLNPKALIFALTLIPREAQGLIWYFVAFSGLVLLAGTGWLLLGAGIGLAAGRWPRLLPRIAAVALTAFAGVIAASTL